MKLSEATDLIRRVIRAEWEQAVSQGIHQSKPVVYSFDVDLTKAFDKDSRANLAKDFPVRSIKGPITLPGNAVDDPNDLPQWAFFIDDLPGANWEHPSRYVFVNEKALASNKIAFVSSTVPPDDSTNTPIEQVTGIFPEDSLPLFVSPAKRSNARKGFNK